MFKKLGALVIDADKVVHQLYNTDKKLISAIERRFGATIISKSGGIDRKKLSATAFKTKADIAALEHLTHPVVIKEIQKRIASQNSSNKLVVIEAPLLFESGFDKFCDKVVLVATPFNTVLARTVRFSRADMARRNNRQMPLSKKIGIADFMVYNGNSLAQTRGQIKSLYNCLTKNNN
jgi:dephospho-CoA kinase